jgi:hypothetical protein
MKSRLHARLWFGLILAFALVAAQPTGAQAAAAASDSLPTISVKAIPAGGISHNVLLSAHVNDPSGAALVDGQVQLLIKVPQFQDASLLLLSTVRTDAQGNVHYSYTPRWNGTLQFTARYLPTDGKPLVVTTTLAENAAVSAYVAPAAGSLSGVGTGLIIALVILVGSIWGVLLGLLVWVLRALPRRTSLVPSQNQGAATLGGH